MFRVLLLALALVGCRPGPVGHDSLAGQSARDAAVSLLHQGQAAQAEALLEPLLDKTQDPGVAIELGWSRWAQADWQGCVQAWEQAEDLGTTAPSWLDEAQKRADGSWTDESTVAKDGASVDSRVVRIAWSGDIGPFLDPDQDMPKALDATFPKIRGADLAFGHLAVPCARRPPLCEQGPCPTLPKTTCVALARAGYAALSLQGLESPDETIATIGEEGAVLFGTEPEPTTLDVGSLRIVLHALGDLSQEQALSDLYKGLSSYPKAINLVSIESPERPSQAQMRKMIRKGADLVVIHDSLGIGTVELISGRLVIWGLGTITGKGGEPAIIVNADIAGDGTFLGGSLSSYIINDDGIPEVDPERTALKRVMEHLDQLDDDRQSPRLDRNGNMSQPVARSQ